MAGIFSVSEVIGIAVEIEKRGESFYRKMVEIARNEEVKKTLSLLAGEEVKHQKFFSSLLENLEPIELPAWAGQSEYWAYVNDLIDSHFLFDDTLNRRMISSVASDTEAIHLAMGFEKESILFFTEMKGLVPTGHVKTVEKCIQEERDHLRKLAQLLKAVS